MCVTVLSTAGYTELTTSSIQQVSLPDKIHGTGSVCSVSYYCVLYMIVYVHRHAMYIYELHCLVLCVCVCVCVHVCVNTHAHVRMCLHACVCCMFVYTLSEYIVQ